MSVKFSPVETALRHGGAVLLREAEERDAEAVLAYLNRVGGESGNLLFGAGEFTMPLEQERSFLTGLRKQKNSILLVGLHGGELVSVSSLSCFDGRARTAHRAELAVSVRKDHWGLGMGRAAMEALIGFAKRQGLEVLQLDVRADNDRAVALYRSLGFETLGLYRRFFKIGGEYYDAYSMNLYL